MPSRESVKKKVTTIIRKVVLGILSIKNSKNKDAKSLEVVRIFTNIFIPNRKFISTTSFFYFFLVFLSISVSQIVTTTTPTLNEIKSVIVSIKAALPTRPLAHCVFLPKRESAENSKISQTTPVDKAKQTEKINPRNIS